MLRRRVGPQDMQDRGVSVPYTSDHTAGRAWDAGSRESITKQGAKGHSAASTESPENAMDGHDDEEGGKGRKGRCTCGRTPSIGSASCTRANSA